MDNIEGMDSTERELQLVGELEKSQRIISAAKLALEHAEEDKAELRAINAKLRKRLKSKKKKLEDAKSQIRTIRSAPLVKIALRIQEMVYKQKGHQD